MTAEFKVRARRHNEQGFTLIEVLLALAITGAALASMAGGLHVIARSWTDNTVAMQRHDMILRGLAIFTRDVRGMRRISWPVSGRKRVAFEGTRDQMHVIALEPPFPSLPGLYFIRYRVVRDVRGATLLRERAEYSPTTASFAQINFRDRVPLLQGSYHFHFEYGRLDNDRQLWTARWSDDQHTPNLVRIHIIERSSGLPLVPPLTVRPRIDTELACIRPRSKLCTIKRAGTEPTHAAPSTLVGVGQ